MSPSEAPGNGAWRETQASSPHLIPWRKGRTLTTADFASRTLLPARLRRVVLRSVTRCSKPIRLDSAPFVVKPAELSRFRTKQGNEAICPNLFGNTIHQVFEEAGAGGVLYF